MQLIMHIGTEKTATTTLQQFLYQNQKVLGDAGYGLSSVLGRPNNRLLSAYCQPRDRADGFFSQYGITTDAGRQAYFADFEDTFAKEVARLADKNHSLILTSEHFHSRLLDRASLVRLRDVLAPLFDRIRIIGYFREQSSLCQSLFSSAVRTGNITDIADLAERCHPDNPMYNYHQMMSEWADVFGQESMELQLFDRTGFRDGDICRDLVHKISPDLSDLVFDYDVDSKNFALGWMGVELNRRNQSANPKILRDGTNNPIYWTVLASLRDTEISQMGKLALPGAQKIYEAFDPSNRDFAERFLNRTGNPFAPPQMTSPQDVPDQVPTDVFLSFWDGLMKQLRTLPVLTPRQALNLQDITARLRAGADLSEADLKRLERISERAGRMAPHTLRQQNASSGRK